jgi:hypothetical protein
MRATLRTSLASRFRALLWLALAAIALTPGAKAGTIVFGNITGMTCKCGWDDGAATAGQFTPDADYTLLNVAADLGNGGSSFDASLYILSDSGGLPVGTLTQLAATAITAGSPSSRVEGGVHIGRTHYPV